MNINQRIRLLRKEMGLSQTEFGTKIGLGQAAVSRLEQPDVFVIEQNIRLICETFGVNETWLRTGEGERDAVSSAHDPFLPLLQKYQLHSVEEQILRIYFKLDASARETVCQYVQAVAQSIVEPALAEVEQDAAEQAAIDAEVEAYRQELLAKRRAASAYTNTAAKRA